MNYGHLIFEILGLFSYSVISTIIYPQITQAVAAGKSREAGQLTQTDQNLSALLTIPLALGAFVFHRELISLIYERGMFDAAASLETASIFRWYTLSLPFQGFALLVCQCFYAHKDTVSTVICSMISVLVNVVLNLTLSRVWQAQGLAIATTISAIVQAALLYWFMKRKLRRMEIQLSRKKLLMITVFSAISVAAARGVYLWLYHSLGWMSLLCLVISVLIAVILYLLLLKLGKIEELSYLKRG